MAWYPLCCDVLDEPFAGSGLDNAKLEIVAGNWAETSGVARTDDDNATIKVLCVPSQSMSVELYGNSSWDDNQGRIYLAGNDDLSYAIRVDFRYRPDTSISLGCIEVDVNTINSSGTTTQRMDFTYGTDYRVKAWLDVTSEVVTVDVESVDADATTSQSFPVTINGDNGYFAGFGAGAITGDFDITRVVVERVSPTSGYCCSTLTEYDTCWAVSQCGLSPLGNSADPTEGTWDWAVIEGTSNEWTFNDFGATLNYSGNFEPDPPGGCSGSGDNDTERSVRRYFRVSSRGGSVTIDANISAGTAVVNEGYVQLARICPLTAVVDSIVWDASFSTSPSGDCSSPCNTGDTASAGTTLTDLPIGYYGLLFDLILPRCDSAYIAPATCSVVLSGDIDIIEAC